MTTATKTDKNQPKATRDIKKEPVKKQQSVIKKTTKPTRRSNKALTDAHNMSNMRQQLVDAAATERNGNVTDALQRCNTAATQELHSRNRGVKWSIEAIHALDTREV